MAKKLVRQFKTQTAPAKSRGYKLLGHGANLINPTQAGSVFVGKVDDPGLKEHAEGGAGQLKTDTSVGGLSDYTLGQLLYQQQQIEANQPSPLPQFSANIPQAVDPRDFGYAAPPPAIAMPPVQLLPQLLPPTATATNIQPPAQRPVAPPVYGQPNVGVDITPEQFTLPPQQRIVQEMPPVVDYGPITTPIAAPVQEEVGYIDPTEPIDLTPGPQITATEQSFYEPQPIESAYAEPIQVDYTQPQPSDIPQDDVTNLIDTILPETLEAKTIDFPQEGPQWVEDPQALAAQELIDQADFTQTDPSIYSPEATQTIAEAPEIAYPEPIDYGPTYGDPVTQEVTQTPYIPPAETIQQLPITQPPEIGIPAPVGGAGAGDDFYWEDYHRGTDLETGRGNIDEYVGGPIVRGPEGVAEIAEIAEVAEAVRQRKEGPEFLVEPIVDDKEEFKGALPVTSDIIGDIEEPTDPPIPVEQVVDTTEPRDIEELAGPPIPDVEDVVVTEDVVADTGEPTVGVTQPSGEERDIQTGALSALPGQGQWLYTGPQGYAESRWITSGQKQGPPIISETPEVSGPQIVRDPITGKSTIVDQPLTWWSNRLGYDFNQNAPLPTGKPGMISGQGFGTSTTTGAPEPPNITGISPLTPTGKGGEGRTPFQTFLEGQDNAGRLIPGGLNLDAASLKGTAAINQLRSSYTAKDFEGVDSFEKFGNLFETKLGLKDFGSGVANFIQELTGMEEGDLKGPGLWDTLNTPIPAFSTGEFGITPLDIITVIAGGTAAIGPVLMRKFMDSLLKPVTSAIGKGLKGVFDGVFNRGKQPSGDVSQEDISAYELAGLANSLGISAPAGTIKAGTYYDAGGNVLATNMKPLDFGLHTVDGANAFKDVLHDIAVKIDPNYKTTFYDTRTGQIDIVHADGTTTENASHITTDSEGNMSQGTSANKKTSKKVKWGVHVIGVESIDTVAPRRDKGKGKGKGSGRSIWDWIKDIIGGDDDDEEEDVPPSGN